jgi:hypothetical protein
LVADSTLEKSEKAKGHRSGTNFVVSSSSYFPLETLKNSKANTAESAPSVTENKKDTANEAEAPVGATTTNSKEVLINAVVNSDVNGEESSEEK